MLGIIVSLQNNNLMNNVAEKLPSVVKWGDSSVNASPTPASVCAASENLYRVYRSKRRKEKYVMLGGMYSTWILSPRVMFTTEKISSVL